jgi:hypothetical protein
MIHRFEKRTMALPLRTSSGLAMLFVLLLILVQASAFDDGAFAFAPERNLAVEDGELSNEDCSEAEKCQMCTFSDQKSIPACKQTGRMQKFRCVVSSDEGEFWLVDSLLVKACFSEMWFSLLNLQTSHWRKEPKFEVARKRKRMRSLAW